MEYFTELLQEYKLTLDWLKSLKIKIVGRLKIYEKELTKIANTKVSQNGMLIDGLSRVIPILQNITEILCIRKAFQGFMVNKEFRNKLEKAINGAIYAINENPLNDSCSARNYQFELYAAALFKNSGCVIEFNGKADFVALKNDIKIFAECKRIGSTNKLLKEVKSAIQNTIRCLDKDSCGLIVLNITPMISKNPVFIKTEAEATNIMNSTLNKSAFKDIQISSLIAGIIVFGSFVHIQEDDYRISCPYRALMLFNSENRNKKEREIVRQIFSYPFFTKNCSVI